MNTNKDRRQGGWVSTVVTLVVLVVVGFLCGALAGFLWQEPGLVLAHLSGKTERVEWSESEPGPVAAEPPAFSENPEAAPNGGAKLDAVAFPPEHERVAERATAPVAAVAATTPAPQPAKPAVQPVVQKAAAPAPVAAKPAPAPTKIASVEPAGRFSVQVGAFSDRASADKLVARLKGRGYTTSVKADGEGSMKRFKVRVGPVNGRPRAEELVGKLKGEKLPGWIVDESKG